MTRQYQRLSAPKFCEQQNISYASFIKWRQKFSASSAEVKPSNQTGSSHLRV
ncbi:IS66 family insertion sequence element accessory protein TnpA [Salinibius halmophilus]|uniref:IS66 family insertion sequence element accessory protein TnpA n=1 Tax=Salinibius halmophilus TaxID=1853216 RepID=UPI00389A2E15